MRRLIAALLLGSVLGIAGCWPFGGSTPQQRFVEALNRGHGAEASQIWLHMSTEDRLAFSHSQGMKSAASPDQIKQQIKQHYLESRGRTGAGKTVEEFAPSIAPAGLGDLPKYLKSKPASGPSAPGPN